MSTPNNNAKLLILTTTVLILTALGLVFFFMGSDIKDDTLIKSEVPAPNSTTTKDSVNDSTTLILAFGDSITAGYGIALSDAYPAQLERALLKRGHKVRVINSGVTGETTAGGVRRAQFVAEQKPDIVLIALGGNDLLRGIDPASTRNNLAGTIELFQRAGARVILAGMLAPSNLGESYVNQFNAIYPALAKEFNVPLIPFLLEGVALDAKLNQNDGLHPSKEGATIIAEKNILPTLLSILVKM